MSCGLESVNCCGLSVPIKNKIPAVRIQSEFGTLKPYIQFCENEACQVSFKAA